LVAVARRPRPVHCHCSCYKTAGCPNFDFVCTKMNVDFFGTKIIALPFDILELLDEKDDFTVKHETAVTPNRKKSALAYPRDEIL